VARVRTNIEIEGTYVQAIMARFVVRTKTEAVDLALRHLAGQPMTRERRVRPSYWQPGPTSGSRS
jgi:Arc/MetJ family transcription regulator